MHPIQLDAITARELHEAARAACRAEVRATLTEPAAEAPEAAWEAYWEAEDAIEARHGVWKLHDLRIRAEQALIEWALRQSGADAETASVLRKAYGEHRDRLIEIALRAA